MATSPAKREERRQARERAERKYMKGNRDMLIGGVVGVAAVTTVTTKMPRLRSIDAAGRAPTIPIAAAASVLLGMANHSYALMGAGFMLGGKWIGDWVEQQTWAQPS